MQQNLNQTDESRGISNQNYKDNDKTQQTVLSSKADHEDKCENCRRKIKSSPFAKLLTARYIVPVFRIITCIKIRLLNANRLNQYDKL